MKHAAIFALSVTLAACASGAGGWSASTWDGLVEQTVETRNYQYAAAPMKGQGFKLKFTVKTGALAGVQAAGAPPPQAELEDAARQAAPEGCTLVSVTPAPDGGGVADYACGA